MRECPRYREWHDALNAKGLTLVFPAAYLNNPPPHYPAAGPPPWPNPSQRYGALPMNKLVAALVAGFLAVTSTAALAADAPAPAKAAAPMKLEKPANVKAEDWAKMSDADKQKAVDAAKKAADATPPKKEKKGGC